LTDGGDSTLHYHATDRARANHTGTQESSTISDFADEVIEVTTKYTEVSASTNPTLDIPTAGTYLVDASGGIVVMTLPDVTASDTRAYRVLLCCDGNHLKITTIGGTQTFGDTLTSIEVGTIGAAVTVKANGVDGYEVIEDGRVYYRTIHVTENLDLSNGYESGSIYEFVSATG